MNIVDLFAKGGSLSKTEEAQGEQLAAQLLTDLQSLVGVDPDQAVQILNQFKGDPETLATIQIYVNDAKNPNSDENVRSNAISELTKIFNSNMESQMFKCGGKLQQLTAKFGKGGGIDCGCGGKKLDEGGKAVSTDRSITITNPGTAQADTVGHYSYPSTNGKFKMLSNGERSATMGDNTGGFPIARYANETFMQNHPFKSLFYKSAPSGYFENLVERVNNRFDENGVPIKQDGGELSKLQNGGRAQAINALMASKGYNRAQAIRAYQNLRNVGGNNSDITAYAAPSVELDNNFNISNEPIQLEERPLSYANELPTIEKMAVPIRPPKSPRGSKQNPVSPSARYTPNSSIQSTGANTLNAQLDAANRRANERAKAWQEAQLRSRNMYFPRIDSSLEEEMITPANTIAQGTGVLMPLTGKEARMAQTIYGVSSKPVTKTINDVVVSPVTRKDGGELSKSLKCGGKPKKKK